MARTASQIYAAMVEAKEAESSLSGLTSTLAVAFWRTWLMLVATVMAVHEQYIDQSKADIETLINGASPYSAEWLRQQVLRFQYSSVNPQSPRIDENYNVGYEIVNEEYQIITRCSVKTELDRTVTVKVAKEDPPVALSAGESSDLLGYVKASAVPGVVYNIVSLNSDKIMIDADIYYDPVYSSVISDNVIAAIDSYFEFLSATDFDGVVFISKLVDAIQAVDGVKDVTLTEIRARANATAFASATVIYKLSDGTNLRLYDPVSGYMVGETTAGWTFADTLTFIPL